MGAAKPDLAIFRHALGTVWATGEAAFYVDDRRHYLDAAAVLGIVTHHFRGMDGLRATLEAHRLLR